MWTTSQPIEYLPYSSVSKKDLIDRGFIAPPFEKMCSTFQEVVDTCLDTTIKNHLDGLDCEFDWLVIKIYSASYRELLWSTNHHPRWAIAYKYPAKQATTKVISIERQVWRTWVLTPVAHIDPVELSGATISKVTLHNPDIIRDKDIRIGDRVCIQRSWEVIPYIVCSIPEVRNGSEIVVAKPSHCPMCHDPLHTQVTTASGSTSYYCVNITCPAVVKETIKHFVSRDMMNIEWIGDAIIDAMVDNQIIHNYTDLYLLITDASMRMMTKNLPGMGVKKIEHIIQWLERSKHSSLAKVLYALGIPHVGEKTASILVDHIKEKYIQSSSWVTINTSDYHDQNKADVSVQIDFFHTILSYLTDIVFLQSIHSIGQETSSYIINWFNNEHNKTMVYTLIWYGVKLDNWGDQIQRDWEKLQYVRFAITGTFPLSRDQIISLLVKQWATYCPTITSNTNLLIIGDKSSSKVKKASDKWIECIEWLDALYQKFDLQVW